jgi:hypothetical protein
MKWLQHNVRRGVGFAIKNPRYALNVIVREFTLAPEFEITLATQTPPRGHMTVRLTLIPMHHSSLSV